MKQKKGEKQEEPRKPIDVSLLTNDQLRPWTMDPVLEQKLSVQMEDLEQTISITSPQKKGGNRGDSILDIPTSSHIEFAKTMHEQLRNDPIFQQTFERRFEPFTSTLKGMNIWGNTVASSSSMKELKGANKIIKSTTSSNSSRGISGGQGVPEKDSNITFPSVPESRLSFTLASPSVDHPVLNIEQMSDPRASNSEIHDDDIRYIEKLQKQLRGKTDKIQKSQQLERPVTVATVHYSPVRSPAIIPMRLREYELLKATVDASPSRHDDDNPHTTPGSPYKYLQTLKHRPRNYHADRYSNSGTMLSNSNQEKMTTSLSVSGFKFEGTSSMASNSHHGSQSALSPVRSPNGRISSNEKNLLVSKTPQDTLQKLSPVKNPPRTFLTMKPVPQNTH